MIVKNLEIRIQQCQFKTLTSTATSAGFQTWGGGAKPPASKLVMGRAPRKILPKLCMCTLEAFSKDLEAELIRPSGEQEAEPLGNLYRNE